MTDCTTVMVVDDQAMIRCGLRSILEHTEGIKVVAEAVNGHDAVMQASKHVPDVVLIDIGMPGLNGIEATRKIHAADPRIAIIGLSMYSDDRYVTGLLDAGGRGYLLKTCDGSELVRAITAVHKGNVYVTSDLTHILVNRNQPRSHRMNRNGSGLAHSLTPREREVLQLVAEGLTSKEIGQRLGAALKTVETHRTHIIRKLNIHSTAALTKYALREGLTQLTE